MYIECRTFHRRCKLYSSDPNVLGGLLKIEYDDDDNIWDLFARVVKPDGSSTEYTIKDFTRTTAYKSRYGKTTRLTAAFSGLAAGDVIEMKWTRNLNAGMGNVLWTICQEPVPVREFVAEVKSAPSDYDISYFNLKNVKLEKLDTSRVRFVVHDIPPLVEEPCSPPLLNIAGWYGVFLKSTHWRGETQKEIWESISKWCSDEFKSCTKPNAAIKAQVASIIEGAPTPEEKLNRLYNWCRSNITNFTYTRLAKYEKAKKKRDAEYTWVASDTFSLRAGYTNDVNRLFGSMVRAAGFDVRLCGAASRLGTLYISFPQGFQMLSDEIVSVKVGDSWRLFAPGDYYVPPGLLHRNNETVPYVRFDGKDFELSTTPPSPCSATKIVCKGRFSIDPEGNLTGNVEITYTGQAASKMNEIWSGDSQESIDKSYRAGITRRIPTAEIGDLAWTNITSIDVPLVVKYQVRIPAYAELMGERMAFSPNYFTKGTVPLLTAPTRVQAIFFDYGMEEQDDIEIVLPEGYALEVAAAPNNVSDPSKIVGASYRMGFRPKSKTLVFKRTYTLCSDGVTTFLPVAYPLIKRLAELVDASDSHLVICKPTSVASKPATVSDASSPHP
jgi:hypothetical protein